MPSFLKKDIAGIPAYVWALLVVGAIGIGLYLRKRSASQAAPDTAIPADSSMPILGTDGGGIGGGGVGGSGGSTTPPDYSSITDAIAKLETDLTGAIASIPIPSTVPTPAPQTPAPTMLGTVPQSESPGAPVQSPPPPPATVTTPAPTPAPGPVPGATFVWVFNSITYQGHKLPAKSVWSAADKSLFLEHLGARGLSYAQWKANHASAALRVFGDR